MKKKMDGWTHYFVCIFAAYTFHTAQIFHGKGKYNCLINQMALAESAFALQPAADCDT